MCKKECTQRPNPDDDLWYALEYNPPHWKQTNVISIVAEVAGANDELNWWWIIQMTDGQFLLLSGGCDYTGWDCQSFVTEYGPYATAEEAAQAAPECEEFSARTIRSVLMDQVNGTMPFALYQEQR